MLSVLPLCVYERWVVKLSEIVNDLTDGVEDWPEIPCVITIIINSFVCAVIEVTVIGLEPELDSRLYPWQFVSIPKIANVAEPELPEASVAWTVLAPPRPDGTVNVTPENEPVALVVTVAGEVDTVVPANFIVITELAAKPWPETVTDVPGSPRVGLMLIEAALTLKVAVAELPYWSVTLTVWVPKAEAGTANVVPEGIEPEPVAVVLVTLFPSYLTVNAELDTKFEPETVTDVPTGPLVGLREIVGVVTVKVADAEFELASVAVTVLPPGVDPEGTVKVAVK
jgi:hypothetical protein